MKTIRNWLDGLPEPARSRALDNMWWEDADSQYSSRAAALRQAFNWSRSPERYSYWLEVWNACITHAEYRKRYRLVLAIDRTDHGLISYLIWKHGANLQIKDVILYVQK